MHYGSASLVFALFACTSRGTPVDPPYPGDAPTSSATQRLTVRIRGAGSVVGEVRSDPAGIDCVLDAGAGGSIEKTCATELPAGSTITLTFTPSGAAITAQFSVIRAGTRELCGSVLAATACQLQLDAPTTVEVFPISVPPPAP
jgi:hypothetical protein